MDELQKPPIQKGALYFTCMALVTLLLFFVMCLNICIEKCAYYYANQDNPLVVRAQCVQIIETYDSDDGYEYDVYVRFQHEGKPYTIFYRTYTDKADASAMMGKMVTVDVDPNDPSTKMSDLANAAEFPLLFVWVIVILMVLLMFASCRKSYVEEYGWRRYAIRAELARQLPVERNAVLLALYALISFLSKSVLNLGFCMHDLFLGPAVLYWCYQLIVSLGRRKKLKEERFYLRKDIVVGKKTKDNDGSTDYYLVCKNDKGCWDKYVSKRNYESINVGHVIEACYYEAEKKPVLTYSYTHGEL